MINKTKVQQVQQAIFPNPYCTTHYSREKYSKKRSIVFIRLSAIGMVAFSSFAFSLMELALMGVRRNHPPQRPPFSSTAAPSSRYYWGWPRSHHPRILQNASVRLFSQRSNHPSNSGSNPSQSKRGGRHRKNTSDNSSSSFVSKNNSGRGETFKTNDREKGRGRYERSGKKKHVDRSTNTSTRTKEQEEIRPPPLTTSIDNPRPWYFTCRHGFEDSLMVEIRELVAERHGTSKESIQVSTPALGLVRLEYMPASETKFRNHYLDPVYALQALPECVVVSSPSIKGLSQTIQETLLLGDDSSLAQALRQAPRSSLAIHGLVPGMFKGQTKPLLERRVTTIVEILTKDLRKGYPAARRQTQSKDIDEKTTTTSPAIEDGTATQNNDGERWLLQVLLMTPDVAVASLVQSFPSAKNKSVVYWPNCDFPAGLAKVDIRDEEMPSSAYRKLMEGLECLQIRPDATCQVYDLGACPGGWTWILRHFLDCSVTAIDKSPLDPRLMQDPRIEFIKGDAFTFEPNNKQDGHDEKEVWMVSDVIAYPDRILELLERWCGGRWADYMVVTMKFHGSQPDLPALREAIALGESYGYDSRAKHFFNNKNEVTLMLRRIDVTRNPRRLEAGVLGTPMYGAILPSQS